MPQLEQTIIFPQLLCLIIVFCASYSFFQYFLLPSIAITLKIRFSMLNIQVNTQTSIENKWKQYFNSYLNNLSFCFDMCKEQFLKHPKNLLLNSNKNIDINFYVSIWKIILFSLLKFKFDVIF